MGDTVRPTPDHQCLFSIASEQHGYFTAAQARSRGINWDLLSDGTKRGRYQRLRRGLYRFRDYPSSPHEEVVAAWMALGREVAVVSHESALDRLGLSDVIPSSIHLTVPRSKRHLPVLPGVTVHTTTRPFQSGDIVVRDGVRLTSPTRTLVDTAQAGTAPEQVELAIQHAIARGLTTGPILEQAASSRGRRVRDLVRSGLTLAMA
ncbi:MAG: type IV toxin-antitoxin system AbiEi family antitoxin domain-containing protein [Chloroflexota bacterium]|nr:type IV toxin-antitoxin system AbiEi family antitoxin domain-containing protein [Chloroflexota bacterium]